MVKEVSKEELEELIRSGKKVLVDFYAPWCPPCEKAKEVVEELSKEVKDVEIVKVDIDKNRELIDRFNLRAIPTFIRLEGGSEKGRIVGFQSKDKLKEELLKEGEKEQQKE